jgi:phage terminase large subunit GpA-like protein
MSCTPSWSRLIPVSPLDGFADERSISRDVADLVRPPRRVSVSEAAAEVVRIETPGGYAGPWDPDLTPYMVEPMDTLKSRSHEAVVFVSPARTGKTQGLLDGWLSHCVTSDPGDMGLYFSTQTLAHDYRKRRIERMHTHSPRIREKLSTRAHDTTIEMVIYRNGMIVNLGWPTSSQLAQRDLRYVAMSDYDSFPDDISGEGNPFDLAKKRIQVAMSAGMALVESSPKRPIIAAQWNPDGPHEAPPVAGGILPLYNRGDRRRWYWQCIDGCGGWWEAPAIPRFDPYSDPDEAGATAHVACPSCGHVYRQHDKRRLNASAGRTWVPEGCSRDLDGALTGAPRRSTIASYWLLGCAASFQAWSSIVRNCVAAEREMNLSGDETAISATTNTDQGMPYRPRALANMRGVEYLEARRDSTLERYHVPDGVRVIFATVDVQSNRFEVAIVGYGVGRERWIIDRYSLRKTADGELQDPGAYVEHWNVLVDKVVNATYRLPGGMQMRVRRVAVDSGGRAEKGGEVKVTSRAYEWWRKLRRDGLAGRVWLIKGERRRSGPAVKKSYPDASGRSDRKSGARGDVPVLLLETTQLKDTLDLDLHRDAPGPGYLHIPGWISSDHLAELSAEKREPDGWHKVGKRNETGDLLVYADALWMHEGCQRINWEHPPAWSAPWNANSEVMPEDGGPIQVQQPKRPHPQTQRPRPRLSQHPLVR